MFLSIFKIASLIVLAGIHLGVEAVKTHNLNKQLKIKEKEENAKNN
jgi:hypothetical protein